MSPIMTNSGDATINAAVRASKRSEKSLLLQSLLQSSEKGGSAEVQKFGKGRLLMKEHGGGDWVERQANKDNLDDATLAMSGPLSMDECERIALRRRTRKNRRTMKKSNDGHRDDTNMPNLTTSPENFYIGGGDSSDSGEHRLGPYRRFTLTEASEVTNNLSRKEDVEDDKISSGEDCFGACRRSTMTEATAVTNNLSIMEDVEDDDISSDEESLGHGRRSTMTEATEVANNLSKMEGVEDDEISSGEDSLLPLRCSTITEATEVTDNPSQKEGLEDDEISLDLNDLNDLNGMHVNMSVEFPTDAQLEMSALGWQVSTRALRATECWKSSSGNSILRGVDHRRLREQTTKQVSFHSDVTDRTSFATAVSSSTGRTSVNASTAEKARVHPHPHRSYSNPLDAIGSAVVTNRVHANEHETHIPRTARAQSKLVASKSAIDVSWFASNGLMSRRSLEIYKKEMKKKVLRRASQIETGIGADTNNETRLDTDLELNPPRAPRRIQHSLSLGEGLDDLDKSGHTTNTANTFETARTSDSTRRRISGSSYATETPQTIDIPALEQPSLLRTRSASLGELEGELEGDVEGELEGTDPTRSLSGNSILHGVEDRCLRGKTTKQVSFSADSSRGADFSGTATKNGIAGAIDDSDLDSSTRSRDTIDRSSFATCLTSSDAPSAEEAREHLHWNRSYSCPPEAIGSAAASDGVNGNEHGPHIPQAPKTQSKLVASESAIDVSWFASRGLMSQRSFKIYKKEMKKNVLRQSSQIETGIEADTNNETRMDTDLEFSPPRARRLQHSVSLGEGLDQLDDLDKSWHSCTYEMAQTSASAQNRISESTDATGPTSNISASEQTNHYLTRSASLGEGLEQSVDSYVTSLKECDDDNRNSAIVKLLQSMLTPPMQKSANLTTDEVQVLEKMISRLSSHNIDVDDNRTESSDSSFFRNDPFNKNICDGKSQQFHSAALSGTVSNLPPTSHEDELVMKEASFEDAYEPEFDVTLSAPPEGKHGSAGTEQHQARSSEELSDGNMQAEKSLRDSTVSVLTESTMHILDDSGRSAVELPSFTDGATSRSAEKHTEDMEEGVNDDVEFIDAVSLPCLEVEEARGSCLDYSEHTGVRAVCGSKGANNGSIPDQHKLQARASAYKSSCGDFLTEGMNHLSMTMLVSIYGKLREMSILGLASVKLAEIDVNSHQYLARKKQLKRLGLLKPKDDSGLYLDNTKTAHFVVRAVLDEYEMFEMANEMQRLNQANNANMVYDDSLLQNFKTWVDESRSKQDGDGHFSKGSVMKNLLNAGLEVVWFSDRHPDDITYCICVERESTTVTVVFYGQENVLSRIKNSAMMRHANPIMHEDYECNYSVMDLRAVVSEEILRPRRDTGKTIIDEVKDKVDKIGKELKGGRYNLSVTGHSLGAGYATVAGFYLASDPSLELASAVRVFTFASSRVGCKTFQQSFKHLEETGRLRHARFTNSNDMMSLRPFWDINGSWKFHDWYQHVGMHVNLHANTAQTLDISYDQKVGLFEELSGMIKSYICGNAKKSRISEYQKRMHSSREYWLVQSSGVEGLPSLEELYSKKEILSADGTDAKGSSFGIYILISLFISIEIALLLRFVKAI